MDPLAHNLLFERFLSDRTDTMPDIDLDFAADRRDEVIAYVYERYGAEHTAHGLQRRHLPGAAAPCATWRARWASRRRRSGRMGS